MNHEKESRTGVIVLVTVAFGTLAVMVVQARQVPTPSVLERVSGRAQLTRGPQGPPYRPRGPIAIVGGLLIDATVAPPRHDQTVPSGLSTWGRRRMCAYRLERKLSTLGGMTVMPGLSDSNQHVVLNPLFSAPDVSLSYEDFKARWEHNWAQMERNSFIYLMQGITNFRQTPAPRTGSWI